MKRRSHAFGLALGTTLVYLGAIVLLPLGALVAKTMGATWESFWAAATSARAFASYGVTFGCALAAAIVNAVFGLLVAWVLVRHDFPGRRILDAFVDLPFALPTAVAGIALTALFTKNGLLGEPLAALGVEVAFTRLGIVVALVFIGFPFVVRTVQPILEDLDADAEEAGLCLGASRWQVFRRIIFPELFPAVLSGTALAFSRALGEYGSVVFISGNMPMKTEIVPLLIVTKLEQYDYAGATAIAVVMLATSFVLLFAVNGLQWLVRRHTEPKKGS
ncbi:sulfate ABC transporter permease subunit CysT [Myxococcota bacterium]|nr:sulfate ABC transporter permease subunit CysT [Myxococcota bacterium]